MKKYVYSVLAVLACMITVMLPIKTEAASSTWYKEYKYELNKDTKYIFLQEYKGNGKKIVVPGSATINGVRYRTTFDIKNDVSIWSKGKNRITSITFKKGTKMPMQASCMFCDMKKLKTLDLNACDTSEMLWAHRMFAGCENLTTLKINKWDTSNVTDMSTMFAGCKKLKSLDVRNWDTSNVEYMQCIFDHCCSLTSLDLNKWDVSKIESMFCMFQCCCKLETLKVDKWDTRNVNYMVSVFDHCIKLRNLDVSKWNTKKVTTMWFLFYKCESLESLDLRKWDTSKVTQMDEMFSRCFRLKSIKFGKGWNTKKVKSASAMFNCCYSLQKLDISMFDLRRAKDLSLMINRCPDLKEFKTPKKTIRNIDIQANFYVKKNGVITSTVYPAYTSLPKLKKSVTLVTVDRVPKPTVISISNQKGKKIALTTAPLPLWTYLQVECSTNKKFTNSQGKLYPNTVETINREVQGIQQTYPTQQIQCVIGKLKKGKTYYVRVRTVATTGRSSPWSKTYKIKVKK